MAKSNNPSRPSLVQRVFTFVRHVQQLQWLLLATVIAAAVIVVAVVVRQCAASSAVAVAEDARTLSLTQLVAAQSIGQWVFLTIDDEEMVDTMRRRLTGDDYLVRIYYGTLHLGFDMNDVKEGWLTVDDSRAVSVVLPHVRLLDEGFIDEARTVSFYESGTWGDDVRDDMYLRAERRMRRRCLTKANISSAEDNAQRQFRRLLTTLGYHTISIRFE